MAKTILSKKSVPATEQKPAISEADQRVSIPLSVELRGEHLEKVGQHMSELSRLLYDDKDGNGFGNPGDVESGVSLLLDALADDVSKLGGELKDLGRIATARGYK